jgi:hypothetical protein
MRKTKKKESIREILKEASARLQTVLKWLRIRTSHQLLQMQE